MCTGLRNLILFLSIVITFLCASFSMSILRNYKEVQKIKAEYSIIYSQLEELESKLEYTKIYEEEY